MTVVENPILAMRRRELKYLLDPDQASFFRRAIADKMAPDEFGCTTIASLYYDTPDRRLLLRSLERPAFKEKIRLRSYGRASDASPVFLELKRKAEGVVYKRRAQTTFPEAQRFFQGAPLGEGQICRELAAFRDRFGTLDPAVLILCERTAFYEPKGEIRMTIDEAPRYRALGLDPRLPEEGECLLPAGHAILEIKVQSAMPLWLTGILDQGCIRKASFSKAGEAFAIELKRERSAKRSVEKCLNPFITEPSPLPSSSLWRSPRSCPG